MKNEGKHKLLLNGFNHTSLYSQFIVKVGRLKVLQQREKSKALRKDIDSIINGSDSLLNNSI